MTDANDNDETIKVIQKSVGIATENLSTCVQFLELMKKVDLSGKVGEVDIASIKNKYNLTIQQLNSCINLFQAMENIVKTQTERLSVYESAFKRTNEELQKLIIPK